MQCCAMQCNAVLRNAVQCSAVQCSAVQCSAVQCSAVQCITIFPLILLKNLTRLNVTDCTAADVGSLLPQGWHSVAEPVIARQPINEPSLRRWSPYLARITALISQSRQDLLSSAVNDLSSWLEQVQPGRSGSGVSALLMGHES